MFRIKRNINQLSDNELLNKYKNSKDIEYLGELYNRYMSLVYGSCLKYFKNSNNAQDAVMQIFEELVDKTLNHTIQNFKSWLFVLTKNHCLMQLRKDGKTKTINFEDSFMEFEEELHLDKVMEDESRFKALEDCIQALPTEQRVGIIKFYMENLSYIEICEVTGYDSKKVKSYIQNGKRNLKLCLDRKGINTKFVENTAVK